MQRDFPGIHHGQRGRDRRAGGLRRARMAIPFLLLAGAAAVAAAEGGGPEQTASALLREANLAGGVAVVLGTPPDAALAMDLARTAPLIVHCPDTEPERVTALRQEIRAAGLYGMVSADVADGEALPYAEDLINLVVTPPEKAGPMLAEIRRVLAPWGCLAVPAGTAQLAGMLQADGWTDVEPATPGKPFLIARKPLPPEMDEWTHYLHGPDGNPVARDTVVGPPEHYRWLAEPLWLRSHETDSSVSTLVTARGRLFAIVDEAPISLPGDHPLPDRWALVARDAFNGVFLWRVPIRRWGWREWKNTWFTNRPGDFPLDIRKRLVAVGDKVYVTLGYRAPVSELDARTGEILRTFADTEGAGEILVVGDGTLIVSKPTDGKARIAAVDPKTGRTRWTTDESFRGTTVDYLKWSGLRGGVEPATIDPALNLASDGRLVAALDGPDIVAVDAGTGNLLWRTPFPQAEADRTAGGMRSGGDVWNGSLIVADGVVLHADPSKLAAFDGATGDILWEQPKAYIGHLWYEWKDVFVIDGLVWTWGEDLARGEIVNNGKTERPLYPTTAKGRDLRTGEVRRSVPLGTIFNANHHHRCYRNKATSRYILAGRRGTEFVDLVDGKHTVHNWVRGTCHVGIMPAYGLEIAPPHPCACYIEEKLHGMNALAPAIPGYLPPEASGDEALERGSAYGDTPGPGPGPDDWPAFRHDSLRTGAARSPVPGKPVEAWRTHVGTRLSAPVVADGKVFAAAADEHIVACYDAATGTKLWEHIAGGRIDSPPTVHRATVIFGCADGRVTCLRATDGALVWRFRAAPRNRLIAAFGQLESAWPVHGSAPVENGVVYVAAGRTSQLDGGIFLYGLDAETGAVRHRARLQGPDYAVGDFEANFKLPMGALSDILVSDGTTLFMRGEAFDMNLERKVAKPELQAKSGFLDDSYFKRTPWTFAGQYARLLVRDNRSVYYVRMFDSLRGLDPTVYFTPSAQGYLVFAKNLNGEQGGWSKRIPVRIRAMALGENGLAVAGPPDRVDAEDPLGAFEGRRGGVLRVLASESGETDAECPLAAPPVFNGIALANGRIYLAAEDGTLACFEDAR